MTQLTSFLKAVSGRLAKCHTGALMVDSCPSVNHDLAHVRFIETPQGKLEFDLATAVEVIRVLSGALAETSRTIAKPISMTDAIIQLSEIETRYDKALAKVEALLAADSRRES